MFIIGIRTLLYSMQRATVALVTRLAVAPSSMAPSASAHCANGEKSNAAWTRPARTGAGVDVPTTSDERI